MSDLKREGTATRIMPIRIDLVFDAGCPNAAAAREQLRRACALLGWPAWWREWHSDAPDCPEYARGFGSPSIFVQGREITGASRNDAASCRLYTDREGRHAGVPPVELLLDRFRAAAEEKRTAD